jgi:hypothetical protein
VNVKLQKLKDFEGVLVQYLNRFKTTHQQSLEHYINASLYFNLHKQDFLKLEIPAFLELSQTLQNPNLCNDVGPLFWKSI